MSAYLIRRLATSIVVVIGVSIFIFFLLHVIYPSPAQDILGPEGDAGIGQFLEPPARLRPAVARASTSRT